MYKQFKKEYNEEIENQNNPDLIKKTNDWLFDGSNRKYSYHFEWLGRPIIQYPQDIVQLQEIVYSTKPDLIIETGIAHGGSLMLSASMLLQLEYCDAVNNKSVLDTGNPKRMVLGIDIDIREHNRKAIEEHPMSNRIKMIQGSSIDSGIINQVREYAKNFKSIMVCLDSNHTHDHVLEELKAYADLTTLGNYCIVFDTIVDFAPSNFYPDRPWGKGNNPKTAVYEFILINIDVLNKDNYIINLFNWGEPFINPEINQILKILEKNNLKAIISSNFIKRPDIWDDNYKNISHQVFSICSLDEKQYKRIYGADLKVVLDNFSYFVDNKNKFNKDMIVSVNWLIYKFNQMELTKAIEYFKNIGVNYTLDNYYAYINDGYAFYKYLNGSLEGYDIKELEKDIDLERTKDIIEIAPNYFACHIKEKVIINESGNLCLCCSVTSKQEEYNLGNILDMSKNDIINIKNSRKFCDECESSKIPWFYAIGNGLSPSKIINIKKEIEIRKLLMSNEIKTTKTTIGIPVYNEIQFIERTITSALGQADQIVISDNASTDGTSELCQEYAKKYPEIKYFRFDKNMGSMSNFINCAKLSDNDYFMYLGGHDLISRNYIKGLKKILDTTDAILAYSNAVHLTDDYSFLSRYEYIDMFKELGSDNPSVRVMSIIGKLCDCTIFNGLYKKDYLNKCIESLKSKQEIVDHGILCKLASFGKMILSNDVTFYRIAPRKKENYWPESLTRVMQMNYGDNYNPTIHIPERIPISIAEFCMNLAYEVQIYSDNTDIYLSKIKNILLSKWGSSPYIINYLQNLESFKKIKDNLETADNTCTNNFSNEISELNTMLNNSNQKLEKLINSIAWWIPVRKWRDSFRKKFE